MNRKEAKAVIWDMDGVIADTAGYHMQAWQEAWLKRGKKFTEEDFRRGFGRRNEEIIRGILGEDVTQEEIDAIAGEKEESFRRRIGQNIQPLPGAKELMAKLAECRIKMALASSTPMENICLLNDSMGINDCFQSIVSADDVAEGKPSPQVFLKAAEKLGVESENCLVIEDAVAGITAAKRAGMRCLAVTNTHPEASLIEADLVVKTLETITVEDILQLLD